MTFARSLRIITAGGIASLALFAVACGGGDDDDSTADSGDNGSGATATQEKKSDDNSGGSYDPCALLTRAEVEAALGEPIDEPKRGDTKNNPMGQQICTYGAASESSFGLLQVSVIREKDFVDQLKKNGYTAKKLYDDGKALHASTDAVSGIGDEAYRQNKELQVRSGKVTISVSANIKGKETPTETLVALAKAALARLPQ